MSKRVCAPRIVGKKVTLTFVWDRSGTEVEGALEGLEIVELIQLQELFQAELESRSDFEPDDSDAETVVACKEESDDEQEAQTQQKLTQ